MSLNDFETDIQNNLKSLRFQETIGRIFGLITLGLFKNKRKIDKALKEHEQSKIDYEKYREFYAKSIELDKLLDSIVLNGVRISKSTFSDIPVLDKADYGVNWDNLRDQVLSRDNYECQESDGSCTGPLQIHHVIPLSRGGSNELSNLLTICIYHHSLKHEHLRNRNYGNIWS